MAVRAPGMTIQFLRGSSVLSRMDALSKLFAVFLISIFAVMAANTWELVFLGMVLSAAILTLGRVPVIVFLRGVRIFVLFGAGLCIFQILFNHRGEQVAQILFLGIHEGGLTMGPQKWMTAVSMGLATLGFIWTTNPREIVAGLVYLGIPYRFAWGLFLVLRYVPFFEAELQVIKDAQTVRGIKEGSGLRGKAEMFKRYTIPLFVSMVTKARYIAIAMDCRCFSATEKRVFRDKFQWSRSGMIMLLSLVLLIVAEILVFGAALRQTITF